MIRAEPKNEAPKAHTRFKAAVIEGFVMLGEQEKAAQQYPLVCELVDTGAVVL